MIAGAVRNADDNHLIVGMMIINHIVLMKNGAKTRCELISGHADSRMIEKWKDVMVKGIDEGIGLRFGIQRNKSPDFR